MCNPEREMAANQIAAEDGETKAVMVLGVDTCGPTGSVALGRWEGGKFQLLAHRELAGRTYSATLVKTAGEVLAAVGTRLSALDAIVVVNGPGSFTGVRVGLSAVKGLAEPGQIPVVAVSRLAVLAAKAGATWAALDAHRHEVFLRIGNADGSVKEMLAGAEEISQLSQSRPGAPSMVAVCDDSAAEMVGAAWNGAEMLRVEAPTAGDALAFAEHRVLARDFDDLALLDGHYLRRSDAEIFGETPRKANEGLSFEIRPMVRDDIEAVMRMAASTPNAPGWTREAYLGGMKAQVQPRRISLIAEERQSKALLGFAVASVIPPEAELESIVTAAAHRRKGVARELFSALKSRLRHQGVHELVLGVRAGNGAALSFYRFMGFTEDGRRPAYYADPVEDAVLMRLRLA